MRKGELEEIKHLSQAVSDWDKTKQIREFVKILELNIQDLNDAVKKEKLLKWLKWARDKADWNDVYRNMHYRIVLWLLYQW